MDAFFTEVVMTPGLLRTLELHLQSRSIKETSTFELILDFFTIRRMVLSSAWDGGKILRQLETWFMKPISWESRSPQRCFLLFEPSWFLNYSISS